eukprot:TRINITY_DN110537_c0_g1_i1.p1 TRINITY_DN110537_c0_g1~~TRINITY_DN110537_c0_g1_i1.p1  ORF type:complete len:574 (+),score=82.76 TRINITY_DN110537_c0_g1_i1:17-1738(+)
MSLFPLEENAWLNWDTGQPTLGRSDEFGVVIYSIALGFIILAAFCVLSRFEDNDPATLSTVQFGRSSRDRKKIRRLVLPSSVVQPVVKEETQPTSPSKARRISVMSTNIRAMLARAAGLRLQWDEVCIDTELLHLKNPQCRPLVAFVNPRSGGKAGFKVLLELRVYLQTHQVVDLQKESPQEALLWWSKTGLKYKILVCGGDGTVGWVLGTLEELKLEYVPPVAILPLGTGNDLARVTGWGGGYTGESILKILLHVDSAHIELLDRWSVICNDAVSQNPPGLQVLRPSFLPLQASPERKRMVMCNYFGIGVDAAVALNFHQMRERRPDLFVSRMVNKLWYLRSGAQAVFANPCVNIASKISLECDGQLVHVPSNLEGIIVLNIASFGGGTNLWGTPEDEDDEEDSDDSDSRSSKSSKSSPRASCEHLQNLRSSMQDKKLEVVGVHGIFHLGASQVGLYKAKRLAQASSVKIKNKAALPIEVDGEPSWFAKDGEIEIGFRSQAFMLVRTASNSSPHAVATDVVDWALERDVITVDQRNILLTEIAHRAQISRMKQSPSTNLLRPTLSKHRNFSE